MNSSTRYVTAFIEMHSVTFSWLKFVLHLDKIPLTGTLELNRALLMLLVTPVVFLL